MTDWRLLRQYLDTGSQTAFSRLVDRHMKLVYWTCRREVRDDQLAEDAAQAVFVLLVRKAPSFKADISLSSWLFQAARFIARDTLRREAIRRRYEEEAAEMIRSQATDQTQWRMVEPWLNDAIAALSTADREAVLLRFFGGLTLGEVADEIGSGEDTARKRVSRAVERIRRFLTRKEVAITSAALAALLAAQTAKAVPAGAQAAVHAAAGQAMNGHLPAHLSHLLLKKGAYLIMQTTKAKVAASVAVVAIGLVTLGGIVHWQMAHLRVTSVTVNPAGFTDLTTASLPASDPTFADHQAIAEKLKQINSGFNRHDISMLRSSLAPDGSFDVAPGQRPIPVSQNLADLQHDFSTHPDTRIAASLVDAKIQGSTATTHVLSVANATSAPGDGEPVGKHITSRQLVTQNWVKRGGKWYLMSWYVQRGSEQAQ
ncbi:MAG TPA: sigma-70 family RNA polymerase sigma factor [Capsulimonadaceae bacterium]|nr:sigma-70 family RNA polymerase sigma factor [Capsulimonadaceae bacterium]